MNKVSDSGSGSLHDRPEMVREPLGTRGRGPAQPRFAALMRAVVNSLPIVVYAMDAEGTVLLSEGRALAEMGSAPGASIGRDIREVFANEPEALAHIERALQGETHDAAVELRRNQRIYHVWYVPTLDGNGRVRMVTGLALDISLWERARRDLSDATFWLERMLENLPVAVFAVAADGTLTLARGSILPEATTDRVGQPLAQGYAHIPQVVEAVERALEGEDQAVTLSSERQFNMLVSPMTESGEVRGAVGVIFEVTEHLRALAA